MYLAYILEYYIKEIQIRRRALVYKIKAYIDEHYTDENLTPEFLTNLSGISARSLRYQFKKEFSQAISTYYTKLRMLEAERLIHDLKVPICDVYMTLGYQNESTFRYHYTNFLKSKEKNKG
nr:AraC family transcriptional regulator [Elizabethkingia anophelis]